MLSVQGLIRASSPGRRSRQREARRAEEARLREAISALPERERLALALRVFESLSPSAIAGVLDLDEATTRRVLLEAAGRVTERLRNLACGAPAAREGRRA